MFDKKPPLRTAAGVVPVVPRSVSKQQKLNPALDRRMNLCGSLNLPGRMSCAVCTDKFDASITSEQLSLSTALL